MASHFEKNVALQPGLIVDILAAPRPEWMEPLKKCRRIYFVGVGTNYHVAQIARALWRRHVCPEAYAAHSFEFARLPQPVGPKDVVVLLSHRGTKSFTVESAAVAHRAGATTVGFTGRGSPWKEHLSHRIETSDNEDSGVFSKSMTTTLAWIASWIDSAALTREILAACRNFESEPAFPAVGAATDIILIGDLEREWVARETALKLQEAAYLRARPFGLEEFLHGPRISAGPGSLVVGFVSREGRWLTVRDYLSTVDVPFIEVSGSWLEQLFWGQRFTTHACRALGLNPDLMRTQDARYKRARESLSL